MDKITTDVLIVGGGTGGVAAAIQASRRGVKTILATEFSWLGGMLTSAGVSAVDGNELHSWQTGLWGQYVKELQTRNFGTLDYGWVSLCTYIPTCGADILTDWVQSLDNLFWIKAGKPLSVIKSADCILGVQFSNLIVEATITIDATELGDLLFLGEIPYRWGWELQEEFQEVSAPVSHSEFTLLYPIQAPTWVFFLQDYGEKQADTIFNSSSSAFKTAWNNYGQEKFLSYGQVSPDLFMINWPIAGNDYGEGLNRLIASETASQEFLTEAYSHSYEFAGYLQSELGQRYGFASNLFPHQENTIFDSSQKVAHNGFALHPYYRESRRVRGRTTITEQDILPLRGGRVAPLSVNHRGEVNAIAIGNYPNDHHYPGLDWKLQPKSLKWGGRWTGTPFTIPYDAIIPESIDGLLVCEKNISVSHIANGSTRLQPIVMNIGQAAGMAAGLCIENNCQPRELPVRTLQNALLQDELAPSAVIPLFNLSPENPQWPSWQQYYLDYPEKYPLDGNFPGENVNHIPISVCYYRGTFHCYGEQDYKFTINEPDTLKGQQWQLITIYSEVNQQLLRLQSDQEITVIGRLNFAGNWLLLEKIITKS